MVNTSVGRNRSALFELVKERIRLIFGSTIALIRQELETLDFYHFPYQKRQGILCPVTKNVMVQIWKFGHPSTSCCYV